MDKLTYMIKDVLQKILHTEEEAICTVNRTFCDSATCAESFPSVALSSSNRDNSFSIWQFE